VTQTYLEFERPVAELDARIKAIQAGEAEGDVSTLEKKAQSQLKSLYSKLGAWEKTQVARHPARPHFSAYVDSLISDYTPLAGDRAFGDDHALLGGLGRIRGVPVVVMGHEKGTTTETRLKHNFGMANPEGYRKAVRLMDMADRFSLPVISFVDTAGAYPGKAAEERGQAEAIARSIDRGLSLRVPFVAVVTGEGGSGGAVAIATANRVLMLEHSIYSVISPEGCASILWRDPKRAADAAKALKVSSKDLKAFGIVDQIIDEPLGGAHRAAGETTKRVGATILTHLEELSRLTPEELVRQRRSKFLEMGRTLG